MEQNFTVTEIVNDKNTRNPEKIRVLYLKHDKTYAEIAELLGLKESTVRFNVSSGGYCKRKLGDHPKKYGDIKARMKEMYDVNPNLTRKDVVDAIGCGTSIVTRYAKELGITLKRKPVRNKAKIIKAQAPSPGDAIQKAPVQPAEISGKTNVDDSNVPANDESLKKEQAITEPKVEPLEEVPRGPKPTVHIEKKTVKAPNPIKEEKDAANPKPRSNVHKDIEKPYVVLDWPFVILNGHIYEVMSTNQLRRELRKDLNIVKSRKQR